MPYIMANGNLVKAPARGRGLVEHRMPGPHWGLS